MKTKNQKKLKRVTVNVKSVSGSE